MLRFKEAAAQMKLILNFFPEFCLLTPSSLFIARSLPQFGIWNQ
jgi:hypothetical protein